MTIQVTQEIIDAAVRWNATRKGGGRDTNRIVENCIIFRALQAAGIPVAQCGTLDATLADFTSLRLPSEAIRVTMMNPTQWRTVHPFSFDIMQEGGE